MREGDGHVERPREQLDSFQNTPIEQGGLALGAQRRDGAIIHPRLDQARRLLSGRQRDLLEPATPRGRAQDVQAADRTRGELQHSGPCQQRVPKGLVEERTDGCHEQVRSRRDDAWAVLADRPHPGTLDDQVAFCHSLGESELLVAIGGCRAPLSRHHPAERGTRQFTRAEGSGHRLADCAVTPDGHPQVHRATSASPMSSRKRWSPTLPPERITPTRASAAGRSPNMTEARPVAPEGSSTIFSRSNANAIAFRSWSSVTSSTRSTSRRLTPNVSSPGISAPCPSAMVWGTSICTRSPASSERLVSSPAAGSTPIMRMLGNRPFPTVALPAIRPPPPIGTRSSSSSPTSSKSSRAAVPWPAMTS